jgi:hypothetical protein
MARAYRYVCRFEIALLAVEFNCFYVKAGEWLAKELAVADNPTKHVSSCLFKSQYPWMELSSAGTKMNPKV